MEEILIIANSLGDHIPGSGLRAVHGGIQIQVDLLVPVFNGHIHKAALGHFQRAARIVHQHVDLSEVLDKGVDHPHAVLMQGYVRLINLSVRAQLAALLRHFLRVFRRMQIVDAHIVTLAGERDGTGSADTMGRTGDQNRFFHFSLSPLQISLFIVCPLCAYIE